MMAASILKSNGIENFMNVAGGWGSIKNIIANGSFGGEMI